MPTNDYTFLKKNIFVNLCTYIIPNVSNNVQTLNNV